MYNHSRHRSIGIEPTDVTKNINRFWLCRYEERNTYLKPQILQGAIVQFSRHKTNFAKGYMPNWTKKHFTVSTEVQPRKMIKRRVYN